MADEPWVFRRAGSKRFVHAWAPDPKAPASRRQVTLPAHLKTKPEAKRYVREHLDELHANTPLVRSRSSAPLVADLAKKWMDLRRDDERKAWSTTVDNASHLKKHILPELGQEHVDELDEPRLRRFVRVIRERVAAFTCRNILSTLTAFLDDVAGEGWARIGYNPARSKAVRAELPPGRPLVGRSQKLRLNTEPAQRLIDSPTTPDHRAVRYTVTFTSGLRDGEISGLSWSDVDLDAAVPAATVTKAFQLKAKKGGARLGKTKTEDSKRVFPLHPAAVAALRWWRSEGWERFAAVTRTDESPVFPGDSGGWSRPRSAELARVDLTAAGLPEQVEGHNLTFHALRRSFSTWLAAGNVPGPAIQRLLGHVPKDVADRHYVEMDITVLSAHVALIPLSWNRVRTSSGGPCEEPMSPNEPMRGCVAVGDPKLARCVGSLLAHERGDFLNRRSQVRFLPGVPRTKTLPRRSCAALERVRTRFGTRDAHGSACASARALRLAKARCCPDPDPHAEVGQLLEESRALAMGEQPSADPRAAVEARLRQASRILGGRS